MAGEEMQKPPHSQLKKSICILLMLFTVLMLYLHFSNSSGSDVNYFPAFPGGRAEGGLSVETRSNSYIRLPGASKNAYLPKGQCDLFSGQWLRDPSGPAYTNTSCNFMDSHQNCLRNGRPDINYLYWRWKPYGCELPPFDPFKFMDTMKDKSWAFIGDSIFRNHIQSMLCLLSKVEEPVQVYHDKHFLSRTWYFANHNFTIAVFWAPFLLKSELFKDDEGKELDIQLHLDSLDDKWTSEYDKHDYVIFSGGQWFLKPTVMWVNNIIVGCHSCTNPNMKEIGIDYSYRKALQMAYKFMASSDHKPIIFFRTWTPDHFEYGEWNTGGFCNRTSPYSEAQYQGKPIDHVVRNIEIEEFKKAASMSSWSGSRLKLLDVFHLSLLRPDGHPDRYGTFHPFDKDNTAKVYYDCLHWCLPGPIDTWNELIMKILFDETDISYG